MTVTLCPLAKQGALEVRLTLGPLVEQIALDVRLTIAPLAKQGALGVMLTPSLVNSKIVTQQVMTQPAGPPTCRKLWKQSL